MIAKLRSIQKQYKEKEGQNTETKEGYPRSGSS